MPVQQVRRKPRHGEQKKHRNDRNENICRNQPVTQPPKEMAASPDPAAHQPVHGGTNRQKRQKVGNWNEIIRLMQAP